MKESEKIMTQVAVIHSAFEDVPNTVAFVEVGNVDVLGVTEALEYAYHKTNNIMGSWSKGPQIEHEGEMVDNPDYSEDVTVMAPLYVDENGKEWGHRSTSMGDMMVLGNKKYKVAFAGFEEIV